MVTALPRVVVAAPGSGHGKTTVATGLMAALRTEGLQVAGFKVGPDYIDPGYHALATSRPGRNLDPHLCPAEMLVPLLLHGATTPEPADIAIVEGVMGLFDGQIGGEGFASTAHVAALIEAPVIVVLDVSQVSRTAAAIVQGLATFDPGTRLSGVILNKAGSARHADEIIRALAATGFEVFGVLPREAGIEAPSRHLGLVPAAERSGSSDAVQRLAEHVAANVSLQGILAVANSAAPLAGSALESGGRRAPTGDLIDQPPGGRHRGGAGFHVPLRRDRRAAAEPPAVSRSPSTRSPTPRCPPGPPACISVAASPRCTRQSCPPTSRFGRRSVRPLPLACRRLPSALGCSTCAVPSTAHP